MPINIIKNTYIHTYIHACIHTYIETYINTYIHTCIHTCISENDLFPITFSTEAARGCGGVWHDFSSLISMSVSILCKILVDGSDRTHMHHSGYGSV
jgi:hypothetical protein